MIIPYCPCGKRTYLLGTTTNSDKMEAQQAQQAQQQLLQRQQQQQQKKAARSRRCKSLLMLSAPFSSSTSSVKSSLLSLLNSNQSNHQKQQHDLKNCEHFQQKSDKCRLRLFAPLDNDLASSSSLSGSLNFNGEQPTSGSNKQPQHVLQQQQQQQQQQQRSKCVKMKLFEQPLDKLFSPKAMKQLNLAINTNNGILPETFSKRTKRLSSSSGCLRKFNSINTTATDSNNNISQTQLTQFQRQQLLLSVIPDPIRNLLNELYQRGPSTVGIFRKSPNAKHCRDLRQKLETDSQSSLEQFQVTVIASVFKVSKSIFLIYDYMKSEVVASISKFLCRLCGV